MGGAELQHQGQEGFQQFHHQQQQAQQSQQSQTITIHCELHPAIDDSSNLNEADPNFGIKAGSTLRGLNPWTHTPNRVLQAWARHQNHPENEWELLKEGVAIDAVPFPAKETLHNLGIKEGDRFWIRSKIASGMISSAIKQSAAFAAQMGSRYEHEKGLRPAPLSSSSPHAFPGPLDTSRGLSGSGGVAPTGGSSSFPLPEGSSQPPHIARMKRSESPSASPSHSQQGYARYQNHASASISASPSQQNSTAASSSYSTHPSNPQKHLMPASPDMNSGAPDRGSKRTKSSLIDPGLLSLGGSGSGTATGYGQGSSGDSTSNLDSSGTNKTTAKIQRYESAVSQMWGGSAWQSEVLLPSFAPVSRGKDAVRAVQQLAKLTSGEGGENGRYPTRVKDAIVRAMQSRINRNKLASQKTTIPDLQEAFSTLKTQNSAAAAAASSSTANESGNQVQLQQPNQNQFQPSGYPQSSGPSNVYYSPHQLSRGSISNAEQSSSYNSPPSTSSNLAQDRNRNQYEQFNYDSGDSQ